MKYHTFILVSLVFSVSTKICNNLWFHAKNDFWQNKLLFENTQLCFSKGLNWILMGNSFVGTLPVRKAFCIGMVNFQKFSFPAHFRNTVNNISHSFYSLSSTVGLKKMYIFLPLNFFSVDIVGQTVGTKLATSENFRFRT